MLFKKLFIFPSHPPPLLASKVKLLPAILPAKSLIQEFVCARSRGRPVCTNVSHICPVNMFPKLDLRGMGTVDTQHLFIVKQVLGCYQGSGIILQGPQHQEGLHLSEA